MVPGDTLMKEGDSSDSIYLLKSGTLKVFRDLKQVGTVKSNELVGEMAFISKSPRSATIIAADKCELIQITKESFHKSLAELPHWFNQYIRLLMKRLQRNSELEERAERSHSLK